MRELAKLDAVEQAELVRRGEVQAGELVRAALERMDALNPLLRAVVTLDASSGLGHAGARPALWCAVCGEGRDTLSGAALVAGLAPLRAGMPAPPTPYAAAINAAGLVTLGKTASSELGLLGSTETLLEGVTHNPWNLSFSAAGSSGGAAAAVAAGLFPFAHANDGGENGCTSRPRCAGCSASSRAAGAPWLRPSPAPTSATSPATIASAAASVTARCFFR